MWVISRILSSVNQDIAIKENSEKWKKFTESLNFKCEIKTLSINPLNSEEDFEKNCFPYSSSSQENYAGGLSL